MQLPELAARSADGATAAHIAAVRELWEESGILLADSAAPSGELEAARAALVAGSVTFGDLAEALDLRLRTDLLAPLSRWVTPPGYPRRFDAQFFAAVLPDDATTPSIASDEVVALEWFRPGDALDAMADGRIGLWLPTSSTLQQLESVSDVGDLVALAPGPLGPIVVDEPAPDVVRIVMPAGGGVAGQPVCAYLVGRRRFVLVDPGDPTGPALERCLEEAAGRGGEISAIALTHADPDHHGGAEGLAERLEIPVFAGPGASRRLPYEVRELADGEAIGDGDVTIRALATPGPRSDHLAYVVGDRGGRADRRSRRPARRPDAARTGRRRGLGSVPRAARRPRLRAPSRRTPCGMSEPTGSPNTPDWPEERGPHLPDAIARVPGPVWPFLALTVLAVIRPLAGAERCLVQQPDRCRRADRRQRAADRLAAVGRGAVCPSPDRAPHDAVGRLRRRAVRRPDGRRQVAGADPRIRSPASIRRSKPPGRRSWATAWSRRSSASSR